MDRKPFVVPYLGEVNTYATEKKLYCPCRQACVGQQCWLATAHDRQFLCDGGEAREVDDHG